MLRNCFWHLYYLEKQKEHKNNQGELINKNQETTDQKNLIPGKFEGIHKN